MAVVARAASSGWGSDEAGPQHPRGARGQPRGGAQHGARAGEEKEQLKWARARASPGQVGDVLLSKANSLANLLANLVATGSGSAPALAQRPPRAARCAGQAVRHPLQTCKHWQQLRALMLYEVLACTPPLGCVVGCTGRCCGTRHDSLPRTGRKCSIHMNTSHRGCAGAQWARMPHPTALHCTPPWPPRASAGRGRGPAASALWLCC